MKKWFSSALFDFRWKKMTKKQHAIFISSVVLMLLSIVLLCMSITIGAEDENGLNNYVGKYVCLLFSFLCFTWNTMLGAYILDIEGRINQKYLLEMNEIRISLGRKPWEDI